MTFFRNVLGTFFTEILTLGLNFIVGVLVARLLPPSERGLLALVMLLPITLAYFVDIGISQSIIYLLGRKKRSPEAVAGSVITLALLLGGGSAILLWLGRDWLLSTLLQGGPVGYFGLVLALLPVLLLDTYLLSILRGQLRFNLFNIRRLLSPLILLVGVIVLVGVLRLGMPGAVAAFAFSSVVSLGISIWMVSKFVPLKLRFDSRLAGEAVGFGLKSYLQNLVGHLHYRLDVYLLALFLPPAQVAFYTVAISVAEVAFYIPDSVGTVLFPRLSVESDERIHALTAEVARHTLAITSVAAVGLLAVGGWLIPVVYGAEYRPAIAPFFVIMPGIMAMAVYKVLTRNYTSRGRQQVSVLAASIALGLNLGLNFILIPRLGMVGAALASFLSYSVSALVLLWFFRRESGIPLSQVLIIRRADLQRYPQILANLHFWHPGSVEPETEGSPPAPPPNLGFGNEAKPELAEPARVSQGSKH